MLIDENNPVSDGNVDDQKPNVGDNGQVNQPKVIRPEDHDRAIKDTLRYKAQVGDLTSQLQTLMSQVDEMKANNLKEKDDYKSLYEEEVKNHAATKERLSGVSKNVVFSEKHRAVLPALRKAGFIDEAEKNLTSQVLDSVEFETTSSGGFIVNGVETFVDSFKREHPYYFKEASSLRVNSGVSTNSNFDSSDITVQKVLELEKKAKTGTAADKKIYLDAYNRLNKKLRGG